MATLQDVLTKVGEQDTKIDSLIALTDGIRGRLNEFLAGKLSDEDQARVNAIFDEVAEDPERIQAAIDRNTNDPTAPAPEEPPAEEPTA